MNGTRLATSIAPMNPASMPSPPMRGVGIVCTSRARTLPTAPMRIAIWRISGVISQVMPPATAAMNR